MAGNLRARLSRMRAVSESPDDKPAPRKSRAAEARSFPEGWSEIADGLRLRETFATEPSIQRGVIVRLAAFSGRFGSEEARIDDIVFFDLETTGLSGGSGTVAFLAALGSVRDDGSFSVRQYFMDDYPAEPAFLERLAAEFSRARAVVTFNGASFDMPLYAVRRAMNGFGPPGRLLHVDALHAARRLWRRTVGDCSLGSLESAILGFRRVDDIPGSEVPQAWFDYLRRGETERLARVFSHNEMDVRSLAAMFAGIDRAAKGLEPLPACDPVGLACLQERVDEGLAEESLKAALRDGYALAARPLMRMYRRQGRLDERRDLVPSLPDDPAGLFTKSVYAERTAGDRDESLRLARLCLETAKGALMERAERRASRLERKIG